MGVLYVLNENIAYILVTPEARRSRMSTRKMRANEATHQAMMPQAGQCDYLIIQAQIRR